MKAQINVVVDTSIKEELMRIARKRSIELDETITYLDLVKEAIDRLIEVSGSSKIK